MSQKKNNENEKKIIINQKSQHLCTTHHSWQGCFYHRETCRHQLILYNIYNEWKINRKLSSNRPQLLASAPCPHSQLLGRLSNFQERKNATIALRHAISFYKWSLCSMLYCFVSGFSFLSVSEFSIRDSPSPAPLLRCLRSWIVHPEDTYRLILRLHPLTQHGCKTIYIFHRAKKKKKMQQCLKLFSAVHITILGGDQVANAVWILNKISESNLSRHRILLWFKHANY
jgi:hypothetical protein